MANSKVRADAFEIRQNQSDHMQLTMCLLALRAEIGLFLLSFSAFFCALGIVLFFDRALLAFGNVSERKKLSFTLVVLLFVCMFVLVDDLGFICESLIREINK